jgi:hypothetical protein
MVVVREDYREYRAPGWVRPTVERLLGSLSPQHVAGLSAVVLTDSATADARKVRRPRRNRRGVVLGRYHPAWTGNQPWIEIVVDRVVASCPRYVAWLQWARDFTLAEVLFHEVGHHLDATVGAPARSGEPAAEAWSRRLYWLHFRRRHRYLLRLLRVLRWYVRMMDRMKTR